MVEKFTKNLIPLAIIVVGILIAGAIIYVNVRKGPSEGLLSPQQAAEKAINYINANKDILTGGDTVSLLNVVEEGSVYKIHLEVGGNEYDSYITKDGKYLFPGGYNLEEESKEETVEVQPAPSGEEGEFSPEQLEALAKCLSEKGAKFYGVAGCSWCQKQKEMFDQAAKYLPYVECTEKRAECEAANVGPIPDWRFPDGRQELGLQSLEKLAELSGCQL